MPAARSSRSYEQIVDQEIGFIGTPEKVIRQVRALQEKGGIGELAIVSNFGGLEHWKSIKTQHMFAKHVMPAFRESGLQRAAADYKVSCEVRKAKAAKRKNPPNQWPPKPFHRR